MSCDKKVPRQALGGELGLAGKFPPHATVITNALQSPPLRSTVQEAFRLNGSFTKNFGQDYVASDGSRQDGLYVMAA